MNKEKLENKIEQVLNNLSNLNISNKLKAQALADELEPLLLQSKPKVISIKPKGAK